VGSSLAPPRVAMRGKTGRPGYMTALQAILSSTEERPGPVARIRRRGRGGPPVLYAPIAADATEGVDLDRQGGPGEVP